MKKLLSAVVSLVTALSFTAVAMAVPATDDMNKSISTLESQDKGAPEASKPKAVQKQKKAHKKHRKPLKKHGVKKEAAPASTQQPSSGASSAQPAPATK